MDSTDFIWQTEYLKNYGQVCTIVQEAVTKTIHKKKKCKKAKWLSEEAFQIAEKREAKGRGERERYAQLNAGSGGYKGEVRKPSSVKSTKNKGKQQNGKDQKSI